MSEELEMDCGCSEYRSLSRRQFLQTTGGVSAAAAAAAVFPAWLPKVVLANHYSANRDVIVSVFQRGGVDGLSVCVPFGDANYYTGRPTIAIPRPDSTSANKGTALDNFFAFPPGMLGMYPAYQQGHLLVAHATGQLNNSRSHFDAQRYMEVGKAADPNLTTGWLGRHLATVPPINANAALRGIGFSAGLQKSLVGGPKTLPISNPASFSIGGSSATRAARTDLIEANYGTTMDPLKSAALDTVATIDLLAALNINGYVAANGVTYPNSGFGRALKSVAAIIKSGVGIEAAQVDIGGWDTHADQNPINGQMFNTMLDFSTSLGAFWADVIMSGFPCTVIAMSEFGRNAKENGSNGTDHGRATAMFAMGTGIAGGRVLVNGTWPGLATDQLEDRQDLKVTLDHRDILAEIVEKRLENTNVSAVFPGYTPTFRGVTR